MVRISPPDNWVSRPPQTPEQEAVIQRETDKMTIVVAEVDEEEFLVLIYPPNYGQDALPVSRITRCYELETAIECAITYAEKKNK